MLLNLLAKLKILKTTI